MGTSYQLKQDEEDHHVLQQDEKSIRYYPVTT